MKSSTATVIYLNKSLYSKVKQLADKKFSKPSYVKSLWVIREYKKQGGKLEYKGGKASGESIKKSVAQEGIQFDLNGRGITASLTWNQYETEVIVASIGSMGDSIGLINESDSNDKEILFASQFWSDNQEEICTDDESMLAEFERAESFEADEYLALAENEKKTLNKPFRTPSANKKFAVYVKNKQGKVVIVRFGDQKMSIKRDNPERRKSFRARHKCDQQKDKTTPAYWSCRMWSSSPVSKIVGEKLIEINPDLSYAIESE